MKSEWLKGESDCTVGCLVEMVLYTTVLWLIVVAGWKLEIDVRLFSVVACAWLAMWLSFVLYGELLC